MAETRPNRKGFLSAAETRFRTRVLDGFRARSGGFLDGRPPARNNLATSRLTRPGNPS